MIEAAEVEAAAGFGKPYLVLLSGLNHFFPFKTHLITLEAYLKYY